MVDDLTRRILDSEQEFRDYPERFTVILKCPDCGAERTRVFPKDEVSRYAAEHDGNRVIMSPCDNRAPNDVEEEE